MEEKIKEPQTQSEESMLIRKLDSALKRSLTLVREIVDGRRRSHRSAMRYRAVERQIADLKRIIYLYGKGGMR